MYRILGRVKKKKVLLLLPIMLLKLCCDYVQYFNIIAPIMTILLSDSTLLDEDKLYHTHLHISCRNLHSLIYFCI